MCFFDVLGESVAWDFGELWADEPEAGDGFCCSSESEFTEEVVELAEFGEPTGTLIVPEVRTVEAMTGEDEADDCPAELVRDR
jgi:hypothetical protein